MIHLAEDGLPSDPSDRVGVTRVYGGPFIFGIARDAHTIFASWTTDWRSVFENAMPADRQVHLHVIAGDGVTETRVAVEPMSAMHYLTTSGFHQSYRVEISYFQPSDSWHSVATSNEIQMPRRGSGELTDIDLATIPFHLNFQQLADLFGASNDTPAARVVSDFQKRVLNQSNLTGQRCPTDNFFATSICRRRK